MLFRPLFDPDSSTYTYLLGCEETREAVLIDPVFERFERDRALVDELELVVKVVLETHVHADHVTAAWLFKEAQGAQIAVAAVAGAAGVDRPLDHGDVVRAGSVALEVRATPGHTDGCLTFVTADHTMAFTGDALLIRGAGRTDFQQGDAARLFRSIREQIFTLPDGCLLYPAHDYQGRTVTSVGEEKRFNPRVGGDANEADFTGYMAALGLPHPRQIDVAVPANLRCGRPEHGESPSTTPRFGPVHRSFAGVPEIDPRWVAEHRALVTVVDVRESAELAGELGKLTDVIHIPLGALRARVDEIPRERPIVIVCRSGRRSAQACTILEKAGVRDVANVTGGMIRWRALGL